jgi:flagellar biosynthesis/type III secretory pathway protein FliH
MRTYAEICKSIGYARRATSPELKFQWVYYEQGKAIPCSSKFEAMKHTMWDELITPESKKIHDEFVEQVRQNEHAAMEIFNTELRAEYSSLSDELFDACYSKAHERGHHAGYDEVGRIMDEVVEFANKVRRIK